MIASLAGVPFDITCGACLVESLHSVHRSATICSSVFRVKSNAWSLSSKDSQFNISIKHCGTQKIIMVTQ